MTFQVETNPLVLNRCIDAENIKKADILKAKYDKYLPAIMEAMNLPAICPIFIMDRGLDAAGCYYIDAGCISIHAQLVSACWLPGIEFREDSEVSVLIHELQHYKQSKEDRLYPERTGKAYHTLPRDEYIRLPWEANANTVTNYVMTNIADKQPDVGDFWQHGFTRANALALVGLWE
jgi:hypothetical protein